MFDYFAILKSMLKLERYSLPAREEAGIIDLVMVFEKFISLSVVLLQGTLRGKKEKKNRSIRMFSVILCS